MDESRPSLRALMRTATCVMGSGWNVLFQMFDAWCWRHYSGIKIPHDDELQRIRRWVRVGKGIVPMLWCMDLDVSGRKFGKHFCEIWVMIKSAHMSVTAKASPVFRL
eukprot:1152931-Pelagomonas_calceolata.AAC.1